ncbi:hypothetical protein J0H58_20400 [bacterium]|nr:hypothetical protein [bacterium]
MKYLCCCQGGKVRSVAAKYILNDELGQRAVLTVGLEKTDESTVNMLCEWAELVLVVATPEVALLVPAAHWDKVVLLDVGPDVYGRYNHPSLLKKVRPLVEAVVKVAR